MAERSDRLPGSVQVSGAASRACGGSWAAIAVIVMVLPCGARTLAAASAPGAAAQAPATLAAPAAAQEASGPAVSAPAVAVRSAAPSSPAPPATPFAPAVPYTPGLDPAAIDDRGVDPCVDFYAFACGGWMKANPIPADESYWSVYSKLHDRNLAVLRQILEQAAAARAAPGRDPVQREIGDFYASCMDEATIERQGARPLAALAAEIAAIASREDLARAVAHLQLASEVVPGASAPFRLDSAQDRRDSSQVIAEISQGGLGLPDRDDYLASDPRSAATRERYAAHVARMLDLFGEAPAAAAADAATVLRLETALARASLTRLERRDPANLDHKLGREALGALAPDLPWDVYFAAIGLPGVRELNVAAPGFVRALGALAAGEDLASWRAYLRWHLVRVHAEQLSPAFVEERFAFQSRWLDGVARQPPRWKRCVQAVDRNLGEALGQAFVARAFSAADKRRTLEMVERIERAMERDLRELPWMSEATRAQALAKLHAVANKIGYPDRWRDYSSLRIARDDYAGNLMRAAELERRRRLAKIGRPLDRGEWIMTPPTVDAHYDPALNSINFPAGVLQPPLFDARLDDPPNYGDTGGTIGHELTHAFDDQGRKFDAAGNLRDWWTPQDARAFEERAGCIRDQYSRYTAVGDVKLNGRLTLGENIADLGGLRLAHMAWTDSRRGKPPAPPIDGLTPDQRFFLGWAQSFCSNQTEELARRLAARDPHSPDRYRVNGVMSNLPELGRAFYCQVGQPMMPAATCRVW
jgi:putative endopeptidase